MRIQWLRVTIAVLIGGAVFAGAAAVDRGLTRPWPELARASWGVGLIIGVFVAVFLLATGLGFLTDETLSEAGDPSSPHRARVTVRLFITVYAATLVLAVGLAFGLEALYGINSYRTIAVSCGTMFLVASTGRPWWLFETIRRVRWFALIQRDSVMRTLLAAIGVLCIATGILGPNH